MRSAPDAAMSQPMSELVPTAASVAGSRNTPVPIMVVVTRNMPITGPMPAFDAALPSVDPLWRQDRGWWATKWQWR